MGYFSNGTEGMGYVHGICSKCIHGGSWREEQKPLDPAAAPEVAHCPVWDLHLLLNGDQFPEHAKTEPEREKAELVKTVLSTLMPRDDRQGNLCAMFVDAYTVRALPDPDQGKLFPADEKE